MEEKKENIWIIRWEDGVIRSIFGTFEEAEAIAKEREQKYVIA